MRYFPAIFIALRTNEKNDLLLKGRSFRFRLVFFFASDVVEHRDGVDEVVLEDGFGGRQEVFYHRVAEGVDDARAVFRSVYDVFAAKDCELLADSRAFAFGQGLDLVDGAFALRQYFEDTDAKRMTHSFEKFCFKFRYFLFHFNSPSLPTALRIPAISASGDGGQPGI